MDNTIETTYYSEEVGYDKYETTNPMINEAVKKRNQVVLDKCGVEIKAVYSGNILKELNDALKAGNDTFDAAMPFFMHCATLAQNGAFFNLQSSRFMDYIRLDQPRTRPKPCPSETRFTLQPAIFPLCRRKPRRQSSLIKKCLPKSSRTRTPIKW